MGPWQEKPTLKPLADYNTSVPGESLPLGPLGSRTRLSRKNRTLAQANSSASVYSKQRQKYG